MTILSISSLPIKYNSLILSLILSPSVGPQSLSSLWCCDLTPTHTSWLGNLMAQQQWTASWDDKMLWRRVTRQLIIIILVWSCVMLLLLEPAPRLHCTLSSIESISAHKPPKRCSEICLQFNMPYIFYSVQPLCVHAWEHVLPCVCSTIFLYGILSDATRQMLIFLAPWQHMCRQNRHKCLVCSLLLHTVCEYIYMGMSKRECVYSAHIITEAFAVRMH